MKKTYTSVEELNSKINYTRRLTKEFQSHEALIKIISQVGKIDFTLVHYTNDPEKAEQIINLRESLKLVTKDTEKKAIETTLKQLEPKDDEKYVILSEVLLKASEDVSLGLGFNNTFPYFFNGSYWVDMTKELMKETLLIAAQNAGFEEHYIKVISRIDAMFKQFAYSSLIPAPRYEKDTVKINLKNGTFTIRGKEQFLADFNSEDLFKYQLSFDYDEIAECPLFLDFLNEVLPEKESQMILAEYLGYVLTKNLKMEKCLVLVGGGSNGKSVVFEIVNALLGENNISPYSLSQLCNDTGYFRINLTNKLLNYASELGGKGCNPDTTKQLISNEPIMARSPYKDAVEIRDYAKLMFNVNEFPRDVEQTKAFFRRFIFLDFSVTIPEDRQDKELANKIIAHELNGVFNWVLEGLNRLLKNRKFTYSPIAEKKKKEIKEETDSVADFMNENEMKPTTDAAKHIQLKLLFKDYEEFCRDNGYLRVARKTFSKRLQTIGYKVEGGKTENQTWVYCERITKSEIPQEDFKETLKIFGIK
ncbi:DNA primase [Dysgonomonas capnocytophagoides]|uniref:DNA primase n=1 Tax=Dysgonomonas capnocytophagoides TaxID=45254 RepID=A0A4Y8L5B5_9BACT|nr:phage/plasmid primase, P4 family [Dysgonomonas capnocytophagoides]TFD97839.1 DNA primase [Dysgonomonas capnocytophagoides]